MGLFFILYRNSFDEERQRAEAKKMPDIFGFKPL